MKKFVVIIIIVLGIIALGLGIYFAWKKSREILTPPAADLQPTTYSQQLPASNLQPPTSNFQLLSDKQIFDYWIMNTGTSTQIFYVIPSGQIYQIRDNENEIVSNQPIDNIQQIKASPNGERILIKSGAFNSPQFNIFNAAEKIWELLPSGITAADFSPDSKSITYLKTNGGKSVLITRNLNQTKTTEIISLSQQNDSDLKWLTAEIILLLPSPSFQTDDEIWALNIKNKTFQRLTSGRGLMTNWSADSALGIKFSVDRQKKPSLELIDAQGTITGKFDFTTLPDKCLIFNEENIYCAIPQTHNLIKKPDLPDDYLKRAIYFEDFIYKVNLKENNYELIYAGPKLIVDAFRLSVSDNQLFFINRYDDRLYGLTIE